MAAFRFEGCVIVSADGMLARTAGAHPPELMVEADQRFFAAKLDDAAIIVHGRNSHEDQPNSPRRKRVIATRKVSDISPEATLPHAVLWNPAGASIEDAAATLGVRSGLVAVIGGTEVFDLFLDRYDLFWLTVAPRVTLPGGIPVFSGVPQATPGEILRRHRLVLSETRVIDPAREVALLKWTRG